MQIDKVQSNQPHFGTRVRISSTVANIIAKNKNKKEILQQIQFLEQNGKNDIFTLTGDNFALKNGNNGIVRGEITSFFKGKAKEQPYITKTKDSVDIENLKVSYEVMINPDYQVWKPKKIKLLKETEILFPYLI